MAGDATLITSEEAIRRLTSRPPTGASKLLGAEFLEVDAARAFARIAYQGREAFCDDRGVILGGILAAMMDEAMAIATTASKGFAYVVPTLGMKASYLKAVRPGRLVAEGQVLRADGGLAFLEGRLFDAAGGLAATTTATARLRKAPWL